MLRTLVFLLPLIGGSTSLAEPSPDYLAAAEQASEVLLVKVSFIEGQPWGSITDYRVEARVKAVRRTAAGLAVGDDIEIGYSVRVDPPWGQPSPPLRLLPDMIVPAFLTAPEDARGPYSPVAGDQSFAAWLWEADASRQPSEQ